MSKPFSSTQKKNSSVASTRVKYEYRTVGISFDERQRKVIYPPQSLSPYLPGKREIPQLNRRNVLEVMTFFRGADLPRRERYETCVLAFPRSPRLGPRAPRRRDFLAKANEHTIVPSGKLPPVSSIRRGRDPCRKNRIDFVGGSPRIAMIALRNNADAKFHSLMIFVWRL